MKQIINLLLTVTVLLTLTSCSDGFTTLTGKEVGDYQVYKKNLGSCEMIFEDTIFTYEDVDYVIWGGGCTVSPQYYIKYEGEYMALSKAYEEGIVTSYDLYTSNMYYREYTEGE